jgi:hypothetical protein
MQGPQDALLSKSWALSNGAGATSSAGFRIDNSSRGDFTADHEFQLNAPALTTTLLPDSQTMTFSVEHDDDPAFGTAAVLYPNVLQQVGAGGAGAAAASAKFRLPANVKRHVRVKATKTGTGNASTVSATVKMLTTGSR